MTSSRLPRILGDYEVVRVLARGGMGTVFEVKSVKTGAVYAAKTLHNLDAGGRARFEREAQLLARCDRHPGIVKVHAFGEASDGTPFIILDLVAGENLDALLGREGRLAPRRAAEIARHVAAALGFAHSLGIVHRDVKPANVFLGPDGTPLLGDFGIARAGDLERLTRTGAFVGTLDYCSPEQAGGQSVGPAADVFSLGATLFHAVAGRPPIEAENAVTLLAALHSETPVRDVRLLAPEVPESLAVIIARALAKAPARRYADGAALARDLELFLEGRAISSGEGAPPRRRWKRAVAGLGLAAVAAAVLAWRAPSEPRTVVVVGPAPTDAASAAELQGDKHMSASAFADAALAYGRALGSSGPARAAELRAKRAGAAALAGQRDLAFHDLEALQPELAKPSPRLAAAAPALYLRALARSGETRATALDDAWALDRPPPSLRDEVGKAFQETERVDGKVLEGLFGPTRSEDWSMVERGGRFLRFMERAHALGHAIDEEREWLACGGFRLWIENLGPAFEKRAAQRLLVVAPDHPETLYLAGRMTEMSREARLESFLRAGETLPPKRAGEPSEITALAASTAAKAAEAAWSVEDLPRIQRLVERAAVPRSWFVLAIVATRMDALALAGEALDRARLAGLNFRDFSRVRVDLLVARGELDEALAATRRDWQHGVPQARVPLIRALRSDGEVDEALRLVDLDREDDLDVLFEVAPIYELLEGPKGLERVRARANAVGHGWSTSSELVDGLEAATRTMQTVMRRSPARGVAAAQKIWTAHPSEQTLVLLLRALDEAGDSDELLRVVGGERLVPDQALPLVASAYERKGDVEHARALLPTLARVAPGEAVLHERTLALLEAAKKAHDLRASGQVEDARREIATELDKRPDEPSRRVLLQILFDMHDDEELLRWLDPASPKANQDLRGRALARLGRRDEARAIAEELERSNPLLARPIRAELGEK